MSLISSQRLSASSSYFKDILTKVGIKLQPGESPNIFTQGQSLIIRDIQQELENHVNYPNNIPDFMSGVKYFCRSKNLFKKALQPSEFVNSTDEDLPGLQQDSLFQILLHVDALQTEIIALILDEITRYGDEEEEIDWVRLLYKSLLFLPYINDSKTLTSRLLEIIEIAEKSIQIDMLPVISDIIPDTDHDEVAIKLSSMLNVNNNELTSTVIHCLNRLILSDDAKLDIKDHILALLSTATSLPTFSLIFTFLVTNCKSSNLESILLKTRNALDSIMENLTDSETNKSDQLITFLEIKKITESNKPVSEGWIHLISSIKSANDHKPVDIIFLIMLHPDRKHIVESIFKKKIKNRQFKTTLLETALQKYLAPQMLTDYTKSILDISKCLLQVSDLLCIEFSRIFYSLTFGHKHTDVQRQQIIIRSLLNLAGNSDKIRSKSLSILKVLTDKHLELMQPQVHCLMTLLDSTIDSDFADVKQIYDILTPLVYGPRANSSMEAFQNIVHITVRKQLGTNKMSLCGIIGAVAVAKNIATVLEEDPQDYSNVSDVSYSNIAELPNESARRAATLLEYATESTTNCTIAQGLYYDQLAQMIVTTEHIDKYFLAWLQDVITNQFQDIFISSDPPGPINDIRLSVQYNLNEEGEITEPIAVRISDLTINAPENNSKMLVFAPLFRLLRQITYRLNNNNLSIIDALLGCGVILPEIDPDIGTEIYDSQQAPQVADCLFHCINWFREIINAFVSQKDKKLKEKVLQRLDHLVKLEEIFITAMKAIPDHKLPPSYFYNMNLDSSSSATNLDKTKSSDKTRKRKHPSADNTTKITQSTQQTTSKPGRKPQAKDKEALEYHFREMDTDLIMLLRYSLITTDDEVPDDKLYLTFPQFKFILKDIISKLNTVTKSGNSNVFSHLITVQPDELITDCVRLMPHISKHLVKIIDETKKLLERSDGIHDSHEMFLQEATELKICFSLNLEMQACVLSWPGFQIGKNLPLLRECLRSFIDDEKSSQLISAHHLILEYLKCIVTLGDYCLTLPCAVHLINIVKALSIVTTDVSPKKKLITLSGKLLSIRWFNLNGLPESGATANLHIDTLVKAHLNGSSIETLSNIVSWIHNECSDLKSRDDNLTTFPSITKANFPILYRGVCTTLLEALQNELHGKTNNQHMELWLNTTTTMRNLMDIVKIQETRANLASFLKKSMGIIKVFLSQGLPILEIVLQSHSDRVVEILRTLQQTTRFIQNLCCHSKVSKDSSLIKHVPQMRLTLETLVNRVKAVLVANNCTSAFWVGALKNKNLHGEEILSQSTNASTVDDQEDNEDDLPVEEESEDESMLSARSDNLSISV